MGVMIVIGAGLANTTGEKTDNRSNQIVNTAAILFMVRPPIYC